MGIGPMPSGEGPRVGQFEPWKTLNFCQGTDAGRNI